MNVLKKAVQMKQIDRTAMDGKYKIAPAVLMENAGRAVADRGGLFVGGWSNKKVLILCGRGNNGGDGFAAARHIAAAGGSVTVYAFAADGYSPESGAHLQTLCRLHEDRTCDFRLYRDGSEEKRFLRELEAAHVVIDALTGTGFSGKLREPFAGVVAAVNGRSGHGGGKVIAVDMPTGVNSDTGAVEGTAVRADLTVTFGAYKCGQFLYPGKEYTGRTELDAIGLPVRLLQKTEEGDVRLLDKEYIAAHVPPRRADSHKGTHGTVGVVTGCSDMAGAALMTAHGSVRGGAGKVFLCVPAGTAPYCIGRQPEIMVHAVGPAETASFTAENAAEIIEASKNWSVIVMGPGMGKGPGLTEFIYTVAAGTKCPLVIDADGLNALCGHMDFFHTYGSRTIITPHLAEFSRLGGLSVADIRSDLISAAKNFVALYGVNLILKGAPTLVVSAETGKICLNPTGNAGMAAGGMGDILSGLAAAMICHDGMDNLCTAACAAVYVHGAAGDYCSRRIGPYGYTPVEVADAVPQIWAQLEKTGFRAAVENSNLL
ncbi:NAD(P)H-hydrate dehydratase [Colibacter massiliensis]|uniref:NAD(P)H-hydrate dehydratase n=1 Tax=Colibacter massiliensis TaxID=1852379 RepID=UPI00235705C5|nr:NAD(P)H-hydrate dehydratase [Colibacter massiliensis]